MSVQASLDIKLHNDKCGNIAYLIQSFIDIGWKMLDKDNKLTYLPINDNGDFDWQHRNIDFEELYEIIKAKEQHNEIVGIKMFWNVGDIGIGLLIYSKEEVSINLNINRKTMHEMDRRSNTDVNWYINSIIKPLKNQGYHIEHFSFEELY